MKHLESGKDLLYACTCYLTFLCAVMEISPSVWNDLSSKERKMVGLMSTMIHTTLEERFDQRRREKEERRLRKEHDKRILEKASRNLEHHGRKEKTLREKHERR